MCYYTKSYWSFRRDTPSQPFYLATFLLPSSLILIKMDSSVSFASAKTPVSTLFSSIQGVYLGKRFPGHSCLSLLFK